MRTSSKLVLVIGLGLAACGKLPEPTGEGYRDLPADQIMIGVKYAPTQDGVRQAYGVFDTVYVFNDSSVYHLKGVQLDIFTEAGERQAKVTSLTGRLNQATDAMTAIGNVVLITPDRTRIETDELHFDPGAHRVWSDVSTRVTYSDGKEGTADSFTADDQFNRIEFTGGRGAVTGLKMRF